MPSAEIHAFWSKLCLAAMMLVFLGGMAQAQQASPPASQQKIDQLIKLLDDPDVRALLASHSANQPPAAAMMPNMSASAFTIWVNTVQTHLHSIADAVPLVPAEVSRAASTTMAGVDNRSPGRILLLFLLLVVIGLAAEFGFSYVVRGIHARRPSTDNQLGAKGFHAFGRSLFAELAPLVTFGVASVGLFVMLSWPPLLMKLIVPTLLGLIAGRVIIRLSKVLLMPMPDKAQPGQTRLIPMSDAAARFWFIRVIVFSLIFFIGWGADGIMSALDVLWSVKALLLYAVDVVLLAAAIETVWHRPRSAEHPRHGVFDWVLTFWLCVLGALSVAGLHLLVLLGLYVILLPAALKIASAIIRTAFAPRDATIAAESPVYQVLIERGVRAAIIALAILWPAMILQFNAAAMTQDAEASRIVRGVLGGIIILLAADIVWEIAKALINHRLARCRAHDGSEAELARSSRLLTLLPILRNFLAVLIAVIAIMMVLSAVGIEVGPLIAGAGIFGVAIGFGSQTLVKDVISGIFYMTDDAFRVGEYIQSGTYKGTVESFSLRSVRLRHHRGPIFTVPFGSLGAVENMSRDWVIDKFLISVSYQTDVALVKKLVKGVGAKLLEDPDLGPLILETVKMKGVEQFGDYGINLSFGMMTKPGQQSMVRRRALAMIREAFTANGIEFASPTVQVGKDGSAADTVAALATNNAIIAQKKIAGEAAE